MRHLFRRAPSPCAPPGLCPASGPKRHGAEGGVSRPPARASCKPHPGSPGGTDPPRPSLGSPQAQAFVSHALTSSHTHICAATRAHTRTAWRTPARGAHTGRTPAGGWGWRRPRKEGTDGRCTHRRPELGEEEERPGNLRLRREGAHRRESKRDAEETPEDNGWAVKGRRGLTGCSRGGNSSNPWHGERGVY